MDITTWILQIYNKRYIQVIQEQAERTSHTYLMHRVGRKIKRELMREQRNHYNQPENRHCQHINHNANQTQFSNMHKHPEQRQFSAIYVPIAPE
jgi:hypothetical protein